MPSHTRLTRLLHRLLGPRCALCHAKVRRGDVYCPSHNHLEVQQYEESRR